MKTSTKKLMTILLVILITLTFLISFPIISASAYQSSVSIEEMKAYLISQSVPEAYLEFLSDDEIKSEYLKYQGKEIQKLDTQTVILTEGSDSPSTRGTIPSEDMRFEITTSLQYKNTNTKQVEQVYVYITYDWLNLPMWRKDDAAIINWDSNVFTYKSDSFTSYEIFGNTDKQTYRRTRTTPAEIVQGGFGYEIKLTPSELGGTIIKIAGACSFSLYPRSNPFYEANTNSSSYYTTAINAQYRHNRNPFVGSVGLSVKGASINFDLSTFTDTASVSTNVIYHL